MVKVVSFELLGVALRDTVETFNKKALKDINRKLRKVTISSWGDMIEQTPIGINEKTEGKTRGSWFVGRTVSAKIGRKNKTKGLAYVARNIPKQVLGKKTFLFNNSPHINVLEFGGYPKNPKRGTFNKRTGKFEIRSISGFSKQAPRGMVRRNAVRWRRKIRSGLKNI